jgi:hypothetical protein
MRWVGPLAEDFAGMLFSLDEAKRVGKGLRHS